jgi:hypothetical protein
MGEYHFGLEVVALQSAMKEGCCGARQATVCAFPPYVIKRVWSYPHPAYGLLREQ